MRKAGAAAARRVAAGEGMYRIGIDVGGTFTDLVLARPNGSVILEKSPTTPTDQSIGVVRGIERLAAREGLDARALLRTTQSIVHGTTTADNAMIEMSGAVTGLITTRGHRDEIELRRGFKENIWDPALPPPPPIAQRRRRIGVTERLDFRGNVVIPLDEDDVRRALHRLAKQGVESLAVVFMFSFINPAHERRVREIAAEEAPEMAVSLSHEVMPSAPEFERTSTTLVNAFVGPRIDRYLSRLVERLREAGFRRELLVMQSNGGIMTPDYIRKRPVTVLASGPTGGVIAACAVADKAKRRDFVCADMGGTSYDICLIRDGRPEIKSGWNWHHRYVIGLPMVDIHSIGAGGGSIASVVAGALHVGPRSAGAEPGPICYGRGGSEVTVTDANAFLGFLNPDDFCSGTMTLDVAAVREAMRDQIAQPLKLGVAEAAYGIYRLVNANMANAIRRVAAERGTDPRSLTLVAYGGNGPVHATAQAAELGIGEVLVPKTAPTFSALGLQLSDHIVDEVRAYIAPSNEIEVARANRLFGEMTRAAERVLKKRKGQHREVRHQRIMHLCYPGQTFDMPVAVAGDGKLGKAELAATIERFHQQHEELHTYSSREEIPVLRSLRVTSVGITEKPALPTIGRSSKHPTRKGKRRAYFDGKWLETPVYDGSLLKVGHKVRGPAIVEEPFTTIVLHRGQSASLDRHGNYRIAVGRPRGR